MNKIIVVFNPKSGTSDTLSEIKNAFAKHNANPQYISIASPRLHKLLKEASPKTTVVAAGGDGTINSVADLLRDTSVPLGIIPAGTLNHFAKALAIPLEIPQAVNTILKNKTQQVDIGVVNDRIFLNNSSIGFYPRSLKTRDAHDQRFGKWPAALLGFLRAALRPRHYHVELTMDDKKLELRTPFVFIGNNEYTRTQFGLGERTNLHAGRLAVYVVKATTPGAIVRLLGHALFTKKRHTEDFALYLTETCTIRTRRHHKMHVAYDGEVATLATPLHFRSAHNSLRVIVP